jgi:tRNA(Met) cytidine acetyltransferase
MHRRLIVLRGTPEATAQRAQALLTALPPEDALWIGPGHDAGVPPHAVRRLLGRSFDAVILDAHGGLDADVLGRCQGFIRGGGALVLRLGARLDAAPAMRARMVVWPWVEAEVGTAFLHRFERVLWRSALQPAALMPAPRGLTGTPEQAQVAKTLADLLCGETPAMVALVAERGRGKSSAVGLALNAALARAPLNVVITARQRDATHEIFRFAEHPALRFATPAELLLDPVQADVIVVDEAAQIPVPALQRLVHLHPHTHMVFATTTQGYEGTGRGFVLRFLHWLEHQPRPLHRLPLHTPIRWAEGDPLERFVYDALLLDARPAPIVGIELAEVRHEVLDRAALAHDEAALRDFFGILIHAHYRTTPADLHRMLDAPNLRLHALRHRGRIIAASLVAIEGGLDEALTEAIYWGRHGVRGHALPETLLCHGSHREAGPLHIVRSVRIAVHPDLRRLGLGRQLVEAVHQTYKPDLFGTLFGGTPELLAFRRNLGYELMRVGVSAGSRTGEPAAIMLWPQTDRARALCATLRGELARDLPLQFELMQAGHQIFLDPALITACYEGLPLPAPLTEAERDTTMAAIVFGARPFEAGATAVAAFVAAHPEALHALSTPEQGLIQARIIERQGWDAVRRGAKLPSLRATMRALRRALQALAIAAGLEPVQ